MLLVAHGDVERVCLTDSSILAARVAGRAEKAGTALARTGASLATQLACVLAAVRAVWPEMEEITARSPWEPGTLVVALEPALFVAVLNALPGLGLSAGSDGTRRAGDAGVRSRRL